jgi:hypothetical protein
MLWVYDGVHVELGDVYGGDVEVGICSWKRGLGS